MLRRRPLPSRAWHACCEVPIEKGWLRKQPRRRTIMTGRIACGAAALATAIALAGCGGDSPHISGPTHAGTTQPSQGGAARSPVPDTGVGPVGAMTPETGSDDYGGDETTTANESAPSTSTSTATP